ncbi:MAG TPA: PAS domain S-box protein, partial [Bauldia sp.]|nr:PAS domain S-box protein [Bauldia sp.]
MTEKTKISLLIIEDTEDDAVLLLRELDRGGFDVTHRRVDRIADIEASIAPGHGWDVIVSDHNLPGFTGVDALGIVRERDAETPFIFVSGTMGEETAVAAVRAGAQDFLVKGKIGRLPTIVTRELRDARTRREQRTVDEKLRQLSRAVEQSANFVVILDRAGQVEYVNPSFCEATGYSAADVSGRRPVFWSLAPDLEATIWESVLSGADWRGEVDNIAHDGRRLSVSATVSPVTNDDGDITHVIVIEEDITRRREIEAQLRQAQKMEAVGNLTGGMAHDFNNLLAVIIGNLDLLCEMQKDNEELQELAREALEAAMSGADLTRRLLAFARREPLDPQVVDVNQIAGSTVRLLRRMLDPMIGVSFSPGGDLWPVVVDPAQLASSITNLATNARDAMPGGGRFELRTSNQTVDGADFVVIEARDTGSGMPPEVLAHIFEPFYTTKEQGKGSGLGLSMVF